MNADGRSVGIKLGQGTCHLPGWAREHASALLLLIETVSKISPFRRMHTPSGNPLRVEMTSCGDLGWVGDTRGYRYERLDPATGVAWPPMPALFRDLATQAAAEAGFEGFGPDTCLINRYGPGDALALHQDRDVGLSPHRLADPFHTGLQAFCFRASTWFACHRLDSRRHHVDL